VRRALYLGAGVLIWAAHFAVIYGFTGLACARGWERAVPWTVGGASLVAAAAAAIVLWKGAARRADFIDFLAAGLAAFALLAILWEGGSAAFMAPCAGR
jgi:hypothetical protein